MPAHRWIRQCDDAADEVKSSMSRYANCHNGRRNDVPKEQWNTSRRVAFLLPILPTFAKQSPPKLEEALNLINENAMRQDVTHSSNKPPLFSDKSQSSIQYLAFLAEHENLFDRALGRYDYDMARAVTHNSQMDPKTSSLSSNGTTSSLAFW